MDIKSLNSTTPPPTAADLKVSKPDNFSPTPTQSREMDGVGMGANSSSSSSTSDRVKQPRSIKTGPLPDPPPSLKEWKASAGRGLPPLAYELVIKDAPNTALEYELYHGFNAQVKPWDIEQRIQELEQGPKPLNLRYTRSAIYFLRKKLEEFVVGGGEGS